MKKYDELIKKVKEITGLENPEFIYDDTEVFAYDHMDYLERSGLLYVPGSEFEDDPFDIYGGWQYNPINYATKLPDDIAKSLLEVFKTR